MLIDFPTIDFVEFHKIHRLKRDIVVTEKLDGTNAQVYISEEGTIHAGSRNRWLKPGKETDNYGFARWVEDNAEELLKLGPGHHFGEWWGHGIQRNYGLKEKKFTLFNTERWKFGLPTELVDLVPVLYRGSNDTVAIDFLLKTLSENGSYAAPGFMNPEGIVVFHSQTRGLYKVTLDHNDEHKWKNAA